MSPRGPPSSKRTVPAGLPKAGWALCLICASRGWQLLGTTWGTERPSSGRQLPPCTHRAVQTQGIPAAAAQCHPAAPSRAPSSPVPHHCKHPKPKESPKAMGQSPPDGPGTAAPRAHSAARPWLGPDACRAKKPNAHRQCLLPAQRCSQHLPHQHRTVLKPNAFNKQPSCTSLSLKDRWVSPIMSYSEH